MIYRMLLLCLCLCIMTCVCVPAVLAAQKPKKPKFKKATIGNILIVPPAGKKMGSIGDVAVKTLLAQTPDDVIGLSGNTNGSELEFVVYSTGMERVITKIIGREFWAQVSESEVGSQWDGNWEINDLTKQEWRVDGASERSCLVTTQRDIGSVEDLGPDHFDNTHGFIIHHQESPVYVSYGANDGLIRHDFECRSKVNSGESYSAKLDRYAPFYSVEEFAGNYYWGYQYIVSLGAGKLIQLDQRYSKIGIEDCKLIGTICYQYDNESNDYYPEHNICEDTDKKEYFLIDPENGTSRKIK